MADARGAQLYHSNLNARGIAAVAVAVTCFAVGPRCVASRLLRRAPPAAPPARRAVVSPASLRARCAGPLLALAWAHFFVYSVSRTEAGVRARLPPGVASLVVPTPRLLVYFIPSVLMPQRAPTFVALLLFRWVLHACSSLSCACALARAFPMPCFLPAARGVVPALALDACLVAVTAARALRAERRAFWAWSGAAERDAPSNAEAFAVVASVLAGACGSVCRSAARTPADAARGASAAVAAARPPSPALEFTRFLSHRAAASAPSLCAHFLLRAALLVAASRAAADAGAPFAGRMQIYSTAKGIVHAATVACLVVGAASGLRARSGRCVAPSLALSTVLFVHFVCMSAATLRLGASRATGRAVVHGSVALHTSITLFIASMPLRAHHTCALMSLRLLCFACLAHTGWWPTPVPPPPGWPSALALHAVVCPAAAAAALVLEARAFATWRAFHSARKSA